MVTTVTGFGNLNSNTDTPKGISLDLILTGYSPEKKLGISQDILKNLENATVRAKYTDASVFKYN